MRKNLQSKEGGTGRIKVIYLVVWSQRMPGTEKDRKENKFRERFKSLEPDHKRAWHRSSS